MVESFLETWNKAALTALGLFWMAFWAFAFGYLISSMVQVFVTRKRMKESMGEAGPESVGVGTFFGFISSSCSFAALSTARSLFTKGAGLIPSLAFLLASTNLVIELGIVISIFLGWQFVAGEYIGGLLLILFMWSIVKATAGQAFIKKAREHAREEEGAGDENEDSPDWKALIKNKEGWRKVAHRYVMEWRMVWKDVTVGFTIAGIIAAFVPRSFFQALFVGAGADNPAFWQVAAQSIAAPAAAFFTFIGSMGNIPLAAVLYSNGVSFAGIMAFIFSDLVVLPVLRIQAKYFGWKTALYITGVFLASIVASALLMHYAFSFAGLLPQVSEAANVTEREFFKIDYTFFLNLIFLAVSAVFAGWKIKSSGFGMKNSKGMTEKILFWAAMASFLWLGLGVLIGLGG